MGSISAIRPARTRLYEIIKNRSFRTGEFMLSSGRTSNVYFNLKSTLSDPEGVHLAAEAFLDAAYPLHPDYMGGLVFGATPVTGPVAALSFLKGRPIKTFFVRKAPKEHGTMQRIEGLGPGETFAGKNVVVIDDVATSGQSVLDAVEAVRQEGAKVTHAIVLVDREEGATERLAQEGVTLVPIYRAHDFTDSDTPS